MQSCRAVSVPINRIERRMRGFANCISMLAVCERGNQIECIFFQSGNVLLALNDPQLVKSTVRVAGIGIDEPTIVAVRIDSIVDGSTKGKVGFSFLKRWHQLQNAAFVPVAVHIPVVSNEVIGCSNRDREFRWYWFSLVKAWREVQVQSPKVEKIVCAKAAFLVSLRKMRFYISFEIKEVFFCQLLVDILKPIWWAWMGYSFPKSHNDNQYFGATWA